MASFSDWLFGSPDKLEKVATGTNQQMQFGGNDIISMLQQMIQQGGGLNLANQYDQNLLGPGSEAFNKFSAPYLQQFDEQILPQIAERFAGAGALSSSGFGQALGGASAGLQSNLAQLFSQLQGQAAGRQQGQFQNLSQTGLQYSPFAYNKQEGSSGVIPNFLTGILSKAADPIGNALGNGISGGINSLFKKLQGGGIA